MKVLITIKENSLRCPGKNFRMLGGEPLYKRALRKFKDHQVFLDTDANWVLKEVESDPGLGHVVAYSRSKEAIEAQDPSLLLIKNFLTKVSDEREHVALVHVTSPFLRVKTLESAVERLMTNSHHDSACSVTNIQNFFFRPSLNGPLPVNFDTRCIPKTQDLEPMIQLNHAFYVFSKESFERTGHRIGFKPYFYPLGFPENWDIDTEEDWDWTTKLAELVDTEYSIGC